MQITDSNTGIIKTAINLFSTTAKKIYCYGKDIYLHSAYYTAFKKILKDEAIKKPRSA